MNNIHLCGPESTKKFLFIEVSFHRYLGFYFFIFDKAVYPGRFNILWLVAKLLYPEQFNKRHK